ncbi:mannitol-1-phosphate 5-dehydrogenase [Neobacillus sp. CF12]|uniref:mannitol-1-phosphate 5-dehydrogenase n=1 Tax=Neobacillus sp. CF12 TaxID=3055864 RepID=UPI0025A1E4E7|nr:mannitol-1-phosphate 5-dehydrogenase [Neobacillus sp. CF12]MDM5329349.1 mannitol-1-phosphate 5-dehydrogenase [Neobacillus sp. CF12]
MDLLNEKKEYRVVLAEPSQEEVMIKNVRAINSALNPEQVIDAIAKADLVTTAIGPNILPLIANLIADGLRKRVAESDKPLNIIACENMIGGSSLLKEKVFEKLTEEERSQFEGRFGFPDSAVDRIVPNQINEDKLMVKVEPFYEWVVEEPKIIGERPEINGITYVQELVPYIERKLFTVNTGHALAAYFGYYYGVDTINRAMENAEISELVEGSLRESGEFLVSKYGFDQAEHHKYIKKILLRFSNSYIVDEVTRVARSPIRKLGANDRLVSPARQYAEVIGKEPTYLLKGIAAALMYDFQGDEEAVKIQQTISELGIEDAIQSYTQLTPESPLFKGIVAQYKQLKSQK